MNRPFNFSAGPAVLPQDVLATERGVTIRSNGSPEIPFRRDEDLLDRLGIE